MNYQDSTFALTFLDYSTFCAYFIVLSVIGLWVGRKRGKNADDYFLAGRSLPWYVVGSSFIASNISSEHFIGMVGVAFIYGICIAAQEWGNVNCFTLMIWFFIPFLLASRVFTVPEYLEKRYNSILRLIFAIVTILSNIFAFLAAVLYGGGLALNKLFGWNLWIAIVILGIVAGSWAIYGGLKSVAWTDFFTIIIMVIGGLMVTILGLYALSGDHHSLSDGFSIMIERNQAKTGIWAEAVSKNIQYMVHTDHYNRLSVLQPVSHQVIPWVHMILAVFSIGIWYNVLNQFMIQRVLGAKNMYHARMGIVLAGYMKVLMPVIIVVPGLILFAMYPEVMLLPWGEIQPAADKGYVHMIQNLVPVGLRGLLLAALFGAIQSTVNSVLNSTATVFTLDIYKRYFKTDLTERTCVKIGIYSSVIILGLSIVLAGNIGRLGGSIFVYIQTLYAYFGPPFSVVFILGLLWKRTSAAGATVAVLSGLALGIGIKLYIAMDPGHVRFLEPYMIQGIVNWGFCTVICIIFSLVTAPPRPEQVNDQMVFYYKKYHFLAESGTTWYNHVLTWWGLFVLLIFIMMFIFSGLFL